MLASKSLVCVRATPNTRAYGSKSSAFSGTVNSFQQLHIRCPSESRVGAVQVEGMLESRGGALRTAECAVVARCIVSFWVSLNIFSQFYGYEMNAMVLRWEFLRIAW